ncbi:MAG TPA: pyridoxamine 5'-phosphate oxidase family protein [Solirubrobacterales bacterium]|nr:pyridoxamine 5'-phosphate oxidase family protein [Solirubrobacterales bacterium]
MRIPDSAVELLLAGAATIVATRDAEMRPALTRGWGVALAADGGRLALCVEAPPGSRVRANLEANGEIAVTCSRPTTYRTVQVKGVAEIVGEPDAERLRAVRAQVGAFSAEVAQLGLPADAGEALLADELLAVTVVPREVFDQTPGPTAGARL